MTWAGRCKFEVSSADPDSTSPVWVDLSTRVLDAVQAVDVHTGRQNDLGQVEPTNWTVTLNNADDALTFGNTSSPYASWWAPGRKCRLRDTVGSTTVDLAAGYIQTPTELLITSRIEQRVTLTAVDLIGRADSADPFISTLGAHIRYAGGSALKFFAPLNDGPNWLDLISHLGPFSFFLFGGAGINGTTLANSGQNLVLADDLGTAARFSDNGSTGPTAYLQWQNPSPTITLPAGQVVTVVAWVSPEVPVSGSAEAFGLQMFGSPGSTPLGWQLGAVGDNGLWQLTTTGGVMSGTVTTARNASVGSLVPVALRAGFTPNVLEAWVGRDRFIGTLTGSAPTSAAVAAVDGPNIGWCGSIAYLQVYVGLATDWDYSDFQEQMDVGLYGLERQTTGARVLSVARYAGLPAGLLANIDPGCSVMQPAKLAGQKPSDAWREAERTEQGLLYVDRSGNLIFKDRNSLYNI